MSTIPTPDIPADRLSHGFKRTLFGFPESFKKKSNQDRYGYLFKSSSAKAITTFNENNRQLLEELGRNMIDEPDPEDGSNLSSIDAGYTYFGQFVDHDLTFDVDSVSSKFQDARKLINYRSPNLDLDSVYGDGPAVDTFMYDSEGLRFNIGIGNNFDLPRISNGTAIIGDPRNDENLIVAQIHSSIMHFHNKAIDLLRNQNPSLTSDKLFVLAQSEVRRHYQWVILHDYLKTILGNEIIEEILSNGLKSFSPRKHSKFFMPVEFSVAAYRFGHSQVRDQYRFNSTFSNENFSKAFAFTKTNVPNNWNIHWPSFFGTDAVPAINKARRIDTRVALSMGSLPVAPGLPPNSLFAILSARNLIRGMALGVPVGQYVARRMGVKPLTSEQLLSAFSQNPTPAQEVRHQKIVGILQANNNELLKKTPLWFYILKEAEILENGNKLGPLGGRIVAEVFLRLMLENEDSFFHIDGWLPWFGVQDLSKAEFKMVDLLKFTEMYPTPGIS